MNTAPESVKTLEFAPQAARQTYLPDTTTTATITTTTTTTNSSGTGRYIERNTRSREKPAILVGVRQASYLSPRRHTDRDTDVIGLTMYVLYTRYV